MGFFNTMSQYYCFIIERIDRLSILFITGFCLPTIVCLYRILCILIGQSFLLPVITFYFIDNRFWEPLAFIYLPCLLLLCFLHTRVFPSRDTKTYSRYSFLYLYFIKLVDKIQIVPSFFSKI